MDQNMSLVTKDPQIPPACGSALFVDVLPFGGFSHLETISYVHLFFSYMGVFYVFLNWGISKSPWVSISTCLQNWMTCGNPATETSGPVDLQERWAQGAAGKVWTWAGGLLNHYPLVNSHITNWKITMFFWWVNPLKMAIFNSKLLVYQRVFQIFETVGCLYSSDLWWMWSLVSLHIVCGPKPRYPDGYLYVFIQWEFQDPKMEVLYHIRPYFGGISPYIGLIYGRYLQFRILESPLIYTHLKIHKIPWFISIPCRFFGGHEIAAVDSLGHMKRKPPRRITKWRTQGYAGYLGYHTTHKKHTLW